MRVDTSVAIYADWDEATPITAKVMIPTEGEHGAYVKLQVGYNAYATFTPEQARRAARALLAAAHEAEARKTAAATKGNVQEGK